MARQVDVKALVSHVVRGDGINRCRICMGDTSEGQVHLNDTVLTDGEKPVTLSELLETVTGIKMLDDGELPLGVCSECSRCAVSAAEFKNLCHRAMDQWELTVRLLQNIPAKNNKYNNIMFAILEKDNVIIINDYISDTLDKSIAAQLLTKHFICEENKEEFKCECPFCNKNFPNAQMLSNHLKESTDLKRACHFCSKIMLHDDLVLHLKEVHDAEPFQCRQCPVLLWSYKQYIKHSTKAHRRGVCMCVDCGRTFQSLNAKHAHLSVHQSKTCPSCDKLFRNHTCYMHHVRNCCGLDKNRKNIHHTKNKVMISVKNVKSKRDVKVGLRGSTTKECFCDHCGKKFAGKKFVAAHLQIVHSQTTHKPCIYCGKFLASARMTTHLKKHEVDLSFKCEHCSLVLKTKLGYIQHVRLHTGERPYSCEFCGECFSASSRRSEHIRRTHKNSDIVLKQACHLCPAKFRLPYRLKKHLKSVHNEDGDESQPQFECDVCLEKFSSCRGLLHHSRKHQNVNFPSEKPEKCMVLKVYSGSNSVSEEG